MFCHATFAKTRQHLQENQGIQKLNLDCNLFSFSFYPKSMQMYSLWKNSITQNAQCDSIRQVMNHQSCAIVFSTQNMRCDEVCLKAVCTLSHDKISQGWTRHDSYSRIENSPAMVTRVAGPLQCAPGSTAARVFGLSSVGLSKKKPSGVDGVSFREKLDRETHRSRNLKCAAGRHPPFQLR